MMQLLLKSTEVDAPSMTERKNPCSLYSLTTCVVADTGIKAEQCQVYSEQYDTGKAEQCQVYNEQYDLLCSFTS